MCGDCRLALFCSHCAVTVQAPGGLQPRSHRMLKSGWEEMQSVVCSVQDYEPVLNCSSAQLVLLLLCPVRVNISVWKGKFFWHRQDKHKATNNSPIALACVAEVWQKHLFTEISKESFLHVFLRGKWHCISCTEKEAKGWEIELFWCGAELLWGWGECCHHHNAHSI